MREGKRCNSREVHSTNMGILKVVERSNRREDRLPSV
jgi:hypothetical protein